MSTMLTITPELIEQVEVRVRGRVQGVGFRPTVWRLAREHGLEGEVLNDGEGVLIRVRGPAPAIAAMLDELRLSPPPLARIDAIETQAYSGKVATGFVVAESAPGKAHTQVTPDAAICVACAAEVFDPFERRYRYPFTNCTDCGPRLTIVEGIPYDRAQTTMAPFVMCAECHAEYGNPADRRFHAQPIACHACGPRARLERLDGKVTSFDQHSMLDDVDAALSLIQKGEIVAIKGLGGYHLACDATKGEAVERLRTLKVRDSKPFALMARDLDIIRDYCAVDDEEQRVFTSPQGPIVLLLADGPKRLPDAVAPGLTTLGFMLPTTPLHFVMLRRMERPVVMTSGNLSDEPQAIDDDDARARLGGIATYALVHDRRIANRVDDSVVRVMGGKARLLRRARGYAPGSIRLPAGFEAAPDLLAMGGELKATFCLVKDGEAILSQHQGDLEDASTFDDYRKNLTLYTTLFDHAPTALVADMHPDYLSSKLARERATTEQLPLLEVQHHHAHVASCLAENGRALDAPKVLGIALDGLGWGDDGTIWGGEFLLADYRGYQRLGTFKPVAMPGGAQAVREPWRNLYAHLMAEMGWPTLAMNFADLPVFAWLEDKPRDTIDAMIKANINSPLASSCGRLFDAVAAVLGIAADRQSHEGEAATRLEAMVDERTLSQEDDALGYPIGIPNLRTTGMPYIEPLAMWNAILGDQILDTPAPVIAARFHKGLAKAIVTMTEKLAGRDDETEEPPRFNTVALSGGCFQNRILFEQVEQRLTAKGFIVLSHSQVPANDGGLALGQAAIGAAHLIDTRNMAQGIVSCA